MSGCLPQLILPQIRIRFHKDIKQSVNQLIDQSDRLVERLIER